MTSTIDPTAPLRIRYMSDLHLEFTGYAPDIVADAGEDLVVLAGDIGKGTAGIHWAKRAFPNIPVLYVLGNHEYYGHSWEQLIDEAYSACDGTNVRLLENDTYRFRGVRFLGCSLWTNFLLQGGLGRPRALAACERGINDYRLIRSQGRLLLARETVDRHEQSADWLRQELASDDQVTVVITHHAPCLAARNPRFPIDEISNTFYSDLEDDYFRRPAAWVFGHTHHSVDGLAHLGTRLYSNQRGYPKEGVAFDWCKVLEVDRDGSTAIAPSFGTKPAPGRGDQEGA